MAPWDGLALRQRQANAKKKSLQTYAALEKRHVLVELGVQSHHVRDEQDMPSGAKQAQTLSRR